MLVTWPVVLGWSFTQAYRVPSNPDLGKQDIVVLTSNDHSRQGLGLQEKYPCVVDEFGCIDIRQNERGYARRSESGDLEALAKTFSESTATESLYDTLSAALAVDLTRCLNRSRKEMNIPVDVQLWNHQIWKSPRFAVNIFKNSGCIMILWHCTWKSAVWVCSAFLWSLYWSGPERSNDKVVDSNAGRGWSLLPATSPFNTWYYQIKQYTVKWRWSWSCALSHTSNQDSDGSPTQYLPAVRQSLLIPYTKSIEMIVRHAECCQEEVAPNSSLLSEQL